MKAFALILLLAASSCAHKELLSANQAEATSQVQRWVPIGTPVADAIRIMEQHEFTTMVVDHGGTYPDCEYRSKGSMLNPVLVCGQHRSRGANPVLRGVWMREIEHSYAESRNQQNPLSR